MNERDHFRGQVAVVTGGGRGIGRAVAVSLATRGAKVFVAARTTQELTETEALINSRGGWAKAVVCDVSSSKEVDALFDAAEAEGPVTLLVCAAATLGKKSFEDLTESEWRAVMDVNLNGMFLCIKRAFPGMRMAGGGRIVTIGSLSGVYGVEKFPGLSAYNVSKYGVIGLTEAVAVEGRQHNISAICISPGAVDTQMLRDANPALKALLRPEAMAEIVITMLDPVTAPASGTNVTLFSNG